MGIHTCIGVWSSSLPAAATLLLPFLPSPSSSPHSLLTPQLARMLAYLLAVAKALVFLAWHTGGALLLAYAYNLVALLVARANERKRGVDDGRQTAPLAAKRLAIITHGKNTSASVSKRIAVLARSTGAWAHVEVVDAAGWEPETLLTRTFTHAVVVIATHQDDNGEPCPPAPAAFLCQWLDEASCDERVGGAALSHLRFAVYGCGDSAYGTERFNATARRVDACARKLGATMACSPGLSDASGGPGAAPEEYVQRWWSRACMPGMLFRTEMPAPELSSASSATTTRETAMTADGGDDDGVEDDGKDDDVSGGNGTCGDDGLEDIEDLARSKSVPGEPLEMVPVGSKIRANLTKQGYHVIGSHSGVKLCRWTKAMLRGRGGCYKHTFYGIASHQCMEATPSLACANKCTFCWRHHTNPVGTHWRWKEDDFLTIVDGAITEHCRMIKAYRGTPGVTPEKVAEGMRPRHCALSLVGEPIMYPHINELVAELHRRHISSFLVTNGQFPDAIANLRDTVTQLYVSVDASNQVDLKRIDRPLFRDAWDRLKLSLSLLKEKRQRTVYRLTIVAGFNADDIEGYARLVRLGMPDLIEVKGVTYCGDSGGGEDSLSMKNVPYHADVRAFVEELCRLLNADHIDGNVPAYGLACEHVHSCCCLMARKDLYEVSEGRWRTWIDYDKFHSLVASGEPFEAVDYAAETPSWSTWGAPEEGFDPSMERVRKVRNHHPNPPDRHQPPLVEGQ